MKVVTGPEMRELEKKSFSRLGLSPLLVMENAGSRIVETLKAEYGCLSRRRVHILVGTGNNGGDGLVVARQLMTLGARVRSPGWSRAKTQQRESHQSGDSPQTEGGFRFGGYIPWRKT